MSGWSPEEQAVLARRSRAASLGLHAVLLLATACAVGPVLFIIANAFTPENEILRRVVTTGAFSTRLGAVLDKAIPDGLYLENFKEVLTRDGGIFWIWFRNSVVVAVATTAVGVFLAATAAYALSRYRFPGSGSTLRLFLVVQMFPGIILIVPLFNILQSLNVRAILLVPALIALAVGVVLLLRRVLQRRWYDAAGYAAGGLAGAALGALAGGFTPVATAAVAALLVSSLVSRRAGEAPAAQALRAGLLAGAAFAVVSYALAGAPTRLRLLDSKWGLILAYSSVAVPFCVYMMKGYFDTIPRDLEEAGLVDGLTPFGAFWRISVPLALPGLAVTAFYSFITAWNEFMYAFTFNLSSENYTLPPGLQTFVSQFRTEWGLFSAAAILVSVPALIFFFLAQRYLVSGLTAGGTKT